MKTHLYRSERSTWCGRKSRDQTFMTRDVGEATCQVCLKANAAEQRKEEAASR